MAVWCPASSMSSIDLSKMGFGGQNYAPLVPHVVEDGDGNAEYNLGSQECHGGLEMGRGGENNAWLSVEGKGCLQEGRGVVVIVVFR